ncbi:MAG TPA: hypothetical protein VN721_16205 [Flavipsychrobacter sp.]|nr:hypothetical protein [Flavipsychrobacter sp.]
MNLNSAICIVFPNTTSIDVACAAKKHNVQILAEEKFISDKEYSTYFSDFTMPVGVSEIFLLFLFSSQYSILADSEDNLAAALEEIKEYRKIPAYQNN